MAVIIQDTPDLSTLGSTTITQASHGLTFGVPVRVNGSGVWVQANSNSAASLGGFVGVVSEVIDADTFRATTYGKVMGYSSLTVGATYFVPPTGSAITAVAPNSPNFVMPIGVALSATELAVGVFIYQAGA